MLYVSAAKCSPQSVDPIDAALVGIDWILLLKYFYWLQSNQNQVETKFGATVAKLYTYVCTCMHEHNDELMETSTGQLMSYF